MKRWKLAMLLMSCGGVAVFGCDWGKNLIPYLSAGADIAIIIDHFSK